MQELAQVRLNLAMTAMYVQREKNDRRSSLEVSAFSRVVEHVDHARLPVQFVRCHAYLDFGMRDFINDGFFSFGFSGTFFSCAL